MHNEATIGVRLRALRKWRKLSLVELADLAGISKSHLSDIERGVKALDRRSFIAGLSSALQVSETDIVGGPHLSADPLQAAPHIIVPALRLALQANTLTDPAVDRARPLQELVVATRELEDIFTRCDYLAIGERLPSVIDELHFHVAQPVDEAGQQEALESLVEACMYATFRLKDLGYGDLAHQAASRAEEAARLLGNPAAIGKAAYCRIQTMPRECSWDRKRLLARRAADALQPHAGDSTSRSVLGMLILTAAMGAAVEHRHDEAREGLAGARALAAHVPTDPRANWSNFCAVNVAIWNLAIAVERGESGGAVVDEGMLTDTPSRYASFLSDVGRGLTRDRKTSEEGLTWLLRAEEVAPPRIRNNSQVRDSVAVMLQRAKLDSTGRELRGLASRMGIPH